MYYSIKGKVSELGKRFIVIETNNIGYEIIVSNPDNYKIGDEIFLYLFHVIKQDDEYVVGFDSLDEKEAFKLLLNVQGIGPKSAMQILANVTFSSLLTAISNNDLEFIKTIPGVSERTASQILLDLSQYITRVNKENNEQYKEIKEILKSFKYKSKDIDRILPKIYVPNGGRDEIVKEALRRLSPNV